ncbi:MAG: RHS repeat-associated core domain-containing protein [Blastococcus sp.]
MFRSAVVPGRRSRASRLLTATGVSLALTIGAVSATPAPASAAPAGLPAPYQGKVVTGHGWKPAAPARHTATSVTPPAPTVLSASSASVTLPTGSVPGTQPQTRVAGTRSVPAASVAGIWQRVGTQGLAVAAAREVNAGKQAAGTTAGKVTVDVLDGAAAKDYGAAGVTVRLRRADGGSGAAPVAVAVPVKLLTGLYGADYASRVRWVEYPDTGKRPSAANVRAVPATTAGSNAVLSPQVASGSAMMLTATASPTSSAGTGSFAATDLKPAGAWQVSAQSGGFSWAYPLRVPPAAAGPAPSPGLGYDSQAVDGETGSTNNQPTAVGDGWALGGGGFVERSYIPCALDNGSSGPVTTSGDLCWKTDNATLSLGGHSGQLVKDSATGTWKLQSDDGSRLEHLTGAGNGTQGGEYWRLTTTDGTQYYFGLGQLPGWAAGKPTTNSAWTAPVYGNDPGEPCHAATFAASACTQGWRWNLDYVVDPHGNAEAYYYTPETNRYAQNGSGGTSYVRGGQLDHIDYGLTATTVYAANAASDKVVFGYADRCVSTTGCDSAHPTNWPDVPWDQNCTAAPCTQVQPSFWSTKMLASVSTQYWTGTAYSTVDTWALSHSFPAPGDGTSAALWLTGITHTGNAGPTPITLPAVTFTGATMQNRVWATDGLAPLDKYRITSLTTETGAVTSVNYSAQQCTAANAPTIEANANTNTQRCFPQWWTPQTVPPQPAKLDLFHKYVVTSVIDDPHTGGTNDRPQETDYLYTGTPAWRYDTSPLTPDNQRTWSVYAGYNTVEVRVGDPTTPATQQTSDYLFFQGLDGDRAATSGGTKSAQVIASDGSKVADSLWLAGRTREAKTLNGVGGAVLSDTFSTAWASAVTANDGTNTARMVADGDVVTNSPLADGSTRRTETRTSYDSYGRPTQVDAITPDAGITCTTTSYATANTGGWLIDYPSEVAVVGKDCSATPAYPTDAISDTRTAYDGGAVGAAPSKGDPTSTQIVKGYTGSTAASAVWLTTATTGYDAMGRITSVTDPRTGTNRTTATAYTPATGGPVTQTVVTNPLGWTATTTYNPAWGAQTSATDVNGHTATATYDALGRRTAAWAPDRPQATNPTPNVAYAYTVTPGAPLSVATTQLVAGGTTGTVTSWALYDGLGRPRQTQTPAEGGAAASSLVTDTYYDPAGRARQHNQLYDTDAAAPSGTLIVPTSTVPGQELFTFDGAGRTLTDAQWLNGAQAWQTAYAYPGVDRTDMTPPAGGTPTTTWTNSAGKTTKLTEYLAATPSPTAQQETTTYGYDTAGRMTGMADAAGNTWSWAFDTLGRQISASDPDTGTTTTGYDDAGRATTTTDARGIVQASTYDTLDRLTALNEASTTGPLLASWTYDTLAKGQLTNSTSYVGSTPGTPGSPYTQAITGYDAANRPTGHATTLPAGTPMAGTYTTGLSYTPSGASLQQSDPAEGGIAAEKITSGYDGLGNINSLIGSISGSNYLYASTFTYTFLGQIAKYEQSRAAQKFDRYFTFQDGTNRLAELQSLTSNTAVTTTADRHYSYDNAGNVTSLNTTAANTAADNQCFSYDALRDLTQAWTPSSGNCATTPAAAAIGGPAPYWTSYAVDPATGNRTQAVQHSLTGGADTVDAYAYPAAAQAHPHAVTTVTHTTGSTVTTDSYGTPDAAGNTLIRPGQTLAYDTRGKLATLTTTANGKQQTSIYDADGNLLVQTDPTTGTTAYLGDTELHQAPGSSTVTATRTYTLNGTPVAERDTAAGVTGSALYFLDPDQLGTATVEDTVATGAVTRRYQDPYGNPRGPAPTWASPHGYLNAPTSTFSGLTHLGARNYDPTIGRFTTVDPLLNLSDPQSISGYAYADNSPIANSDPSGLLIACVDVCSHSKGNGTENSNGSVNYGHGHVSAPAPPAPGRGSYLGRQSYEGNDVRTAREKYIDAQSGANNFFCDSVGCQLPHIDPREYHSTGFGSFGDFLGGLISILDSFSTSTSYAHALGLPSGGDIINHAMGVDPDKPAFLLGQLLGLIGPGVVAGPAAELEAGASAAEAADAVTPAVIRVGDLKLPGVPKGAVGTITKNGKGLQYTIPRGTPELDERVTGIRVMDPTTTGKYPYPTGRVMYVNEQGQTVNPLTGETVTPSDPFAHIPLP